MAHQVPFGRRGVPQRPPQRAAAPVASPRPAADLIADRPLPTLSPAFARDDAELRAWKRERARQRQLPWRQISLMATLCFGLASFVLPSSVNGGVQWLLYALAAASLFAGLRRRRRG